MNRYLAKSCRLFLYSKTNPVINLFPKYISNDGEHLPTFDNDSKPKYKKGGTHIFTKKQAQYYLDTIMNDADPTIIKKVKVTKKIGKEEMVNILNPGLAVLRNVFRKHRHDIRIVGGVVRNILMGKNSDDFDLSTTATPIEMIDMFNVEHIPVVHTTSKGTVLIRLLDCNFQCTSLRSKVGENGSLTYGQNWKSDAELRDFTVNSMSLDFDGHLYDYCNGIADLEKGKIQFIGDAEKRIQEDHIRILRYFRFFSRISQSKIHDETVIKIIKENVDGLSSISAERIFSELNQIFRSKLVYEMMVKMKECGIFPYIGLNESFDMENFRKVYNSCQKSTISTVSLLTAGFITTEDAQIFIDIIKCPRADQQMIYFILEHKNKNMSEKEIISIAIDLKYKLNMNAEKIDENILNITSYHGIHNQKMHILPTFPLSMLSDDSELWKKLNYLKILEIWKKSNYTLTLNDLLKYED